MKKKAKPKPTPKSERVVVDEIFETDVARIRCVRLLRANRIAGADPSDFGIDTWEDEREDFLDDWRVEAFVGFTKGRHLREGDVFFITDGTKLNEEYEPIKRTLAAETHLLKSWDESRNIAREEIKRQFARISAAQMSPDSERLRAQLVEEVEKKFK